MKSILLFATFFTFHFTLASPAKDKAAEAEDLYARKEFRKFAKTLAQLSTLLLPPHNNSYPELGVLRRLEGHACFFGLDQDKNIDLSCAWLKYAQAARAGDAEALFYTAVFLDNFLFDSLSPVDGLFDSAILSTTLRDKVETVKSLAATCFYMSAIGGFAPAMIRLGSRTETKQCWTASKYYSKAAHVLLPEFNQSFQRTLSKLDAVLISVDPFANADSPLEHIAGLRMYEQIAQKLPEGKLQSGMLGIISVRYLAKQEYGMARSAAEKALSLDKDDKNANYVYGVLNMLGSEAEFEAKNYTLAKMYFETAARNKSAEALNALGFIHLNGLGVPADEILAYDYFKKSYEAGSSSGAYNMGSRLLSGNTFSQAESLKNFLVASHVNNFHSLYNIAIMYMYGVGAEVSCQTAVKYLHQSAMMMAWGKYFPNVHDLYLKGHKKVAALMYMIMGEIDSKTGLMNAANLLDSSDVFGTKLWIHSLEPEANLNRRLAFKYYARSAREGNELANLRLGDYYFHGYEMEPDLNISLAYYDRACHQIPSLTQASHALFTNALLSHYGIGMSKNYTKAHEAYTLSVMFNAESYYPVRVMKILLEADTFGLRSVLPRPEWGALAVSLIFVAATIYLISRRKK